jgi:glycosyltransferase involved in cell wall biosynthesis
MRIGLFTDTYRPSINGIVFVLESLKNELEARGHEVYIFCPGKKIISAPEAELYEEDFHIVRYPSIKGAFFDDYDTSVFFPPRVVQQIRKLDLDIIHVFTPSQVGLVGVQAAIKNEVPFIMQHSTDLYEFSEDYPLVLPGLLALIGILLPTTVRLGRKDIAEVIKMYRPRRGMAKWNKDIIRRAITMLYSRADGVIALSEKSASQLESWQDEKYKYKITVMPNGVNAIPSPTDASLEKFREKFGIAQDDEVFGFVGRLGKEKNLDMLIPTLEYVIHQRPTARLLFVGDFEYRETLENLAIESGYSSRITFTGALPRENLGVAYASMSVFVFPSMKDTQGWVLHEAAHAGLPILLIDHGVTSVVKDGVNGYFVYNSPESVSDRLIELLSDNKLRKKMGEASKEIAATLTEEKQVQKLEKLYKHLVLNSHMARGSE